MLPNKPGQLATLCGRLAKAKVNIKAIAVIETAEQGIVRLVVDKTGIARKVVKDAQYGYVVTDVVLVDMVNKPGVLSQVAKKLAKAKVNIHYVYGSTGPGAQEAAAVLGVDDIEVAKKVL
jgi:hypothetical protein